MGHVFSALGFYPVCPGTDQYVLGAPLFRRATLTFENGNRMVIQDDGNSAENLYVESLQLNGVPYTKNYVGHGDLQQGGSMRYRMAAQPNRSRGTQPADRPYSFSLTEQK